MVILHKESFESIQSTNQYQKNSRRKNTSKIREPSYLHALTHDPSIVQSNCSQVLVCLCNAKNNVATDA